MNTMNYVKWANFSFAFILISTLLINLGAVPETDATRNSSPTRLYPTFHHYLDMEVPASGGIPLNPPGEWQIFTIGPINGDLEEGCEILVNLELNFTLGDQSKIEFMIEFDLDGGGPTDTTALFPVHNLSQPSGSIYQLEEDSVTYAGDLMSIRGGFIKLKVRDLLGYGAKVRIGNRTFVDVPFNFDIPVARAGPDMDGVTGMELALDGTASYHQMDRPLTYRWDLDKDDGLGWDLEGEVVNHTYLEAKNYTVTLNVTDGTRWDHDTLIVTVLLQRPPVLDIGPNRIVQRMESIWINGSNTVDEDGDPLSFSWDFGDGSKSSIPDATHYWTDMGQYNVTLTVSDGYFSVSDTIIVTVLNNLPDLKISIDNDPMFGSPIFFNATRNWDPDYDNLTFWWDMGEGELKYGSIVNFTFLSPGSKTITLYCNDTHETTSTTMEILIPENLPPIPVIDLGGAAFTNHTAVFNCSMSSDPEGHGLTFSWRFPDGSVKNGVEVEYIFSDVGIFDIILAVTDIHGGLSEETIEVNVLNYDTYYPITVDIKDLAERRDVVQEPYTYYTYRHDITNDIWYRVPHQAGGYRTYVIDLPGGYFDLFIEIENGQHLDILCFESREAYLEYLDDYTTVIEYDTYRSSLRTSGIALSFWGSEKLYLVVDNNEKMAFGEKPSGNVTYTIIVTNGTYIDPYGSGDEGEENENGNAPMWIIPVFFIGVPMIVIIGIIVYLIASKRSRKGEVDPEEFQQMVRETIRIEDPDQAVTGPPPGLEQTYQDPTVDEEEGVDMLDLLTEKVRDQEYEEQIGVRSSIEDGGLDHLNGYQNMDLPDGNDEGYTEPGILPSVHEAEEHVNIQDSDGDDLPDNPDQDVNI
ncbi:MAG: PKD domain-containing protein [Thermoplasmata archaeon]|nr:PKD domain-containing protein [Thermoplasmata archaeon]